MLTSPSAISLNNPGAFSGSPLGLQSSSMISPLSNQSLSLQGLGSQNLVSPLSQNLSQNLGMGSPLSQNLVSPVGMGSPLSQNFASPISQNFVSPISQNLGMGQTFSPASNVAQFAVGSGGILVPTSPVIVNNLANSPRLNPIQALQGSPRLSSPIITPSQNVQVLPESPRLALPGSPRIIASPLAAQVLNSVQNSPPPALGIVQPSLSRELEQNKIDQIQQVQQIQAQEEGMLAQSQAIQRAQLDEIQMQQKADLQVQQQLQSEQLRQNEVQQIQQVVQSPSIASPVSLNPVISQVSPGQFRSPASRVNSVRRRLSPSVISPVRQNIVTGSLPLVVSQNQSPIQSPSPSPSPRRSSFRRRSPLVTSPQGSQSPQRLSSQRLSPLRQQSLVSQESPDVETVILNLGYKVIEKVYISDQNGVKSVEYILATNRSGNYVFVELDNPGQVIINEEDSSILNIAEATVIPENVRNYYGQEVDNVAIMCKDGVCFLSNQSEGPREKAFYYSSKMSERFAFYENSILPIPVVRMSVLVSDPAGVSSMIDAVTLKLRKKALERDIIKKEEVREVVGALCRNISELFVIQEASEFRLLRSINELEGFKAQYESMSVLSDVDKVKYQRVLNNLAIRNALAMEYLSNNQDLANVIPPIVALNEKMNALKAFLLQKFEGIEGIMDV